MNRPPTPGRRELEDRISELERDADDMRRLASLLWQRLCKRRWVEGFVDQVDYPIRSHPDDPEPPTGEDLLCRTFAAASRLFRHEHIYVEPCRVILLDQSQRFVMTHPSGEEQHITLEQLLMMGDQA